MSSSESLTGLLRGSRIVRTLLGAGLLALLSACGGSVSRVETFAPQRMVVFGDEMSLVQSDGRKYSINALASDGVTLDCGANPVWTQYLASHFGLAMENCTSSTSPNALMRAAANATVADVAQQVATYRSAGGSFDAKTLVTVQGGAHDLRTIYDQIIAGTLTEADGVAQAQAAGTALATVANGIIDNGNGGRVLYVSVPNLALSPFGLQEQGVDSTRTMLLRTLTNAFNDRLRASVQPNDGRYAGPVFADARVQSMYSFPTTGSGYSLVNIVAAACTNASASALDCTTATLQSNASSTNYLWADATHIGPAAHTMIGVDAVTRSTNNPF